VKQLFKPGDQKKFVKQVTASDFVRFEAEVLHAVYATYSLARDFEWSSRLFFIEMKELDEEGVGTFLSIDHKSPAFEGETVTITATVEKCEGHELICAIEARVEDRIIAVGKTGQKMLKLEKLNRIFRRAV
jgi:fluoroacetyl-CoA thioesterase